MMCNELKGKIIKTGYLENRKIGLNFSRCYPELFKEIILATKDIEESFIVNHYLRARVIFLFKYDNNLNKIKKENGWLTFDRKKDDFIDKTGDYRKRGWDKIKENISLEFYSKEDTIKILKEKSYYKNFLGKAKNRTLINENSKLYNSIFEHTKIFDSFHRNENKFSIRMLFLVNDDGDSEAIKCKNCKENYTSFNYDKNYFNELCLKCFHLNEIKYPKKGWFKNKYKDNWENEYIREMSERFPKIGFFKKNFPDTWEDEYKKHLEFKINSKSWYQNKYGDEIGLLKYTEVSLKRVKNIYDLKSKKYSDISQKLFWSIYEDFDSDEKEKCKFYELNGEKLILNQKEGRYFFADFTFKNKIIEYDGKYWHPKHNEKDIIRNQTYKDLGYDVLILNEDDYCKENKSTDTIKKCLKFLRDEF